MKMDTHVKLTCMTPSIWITFPCFWNRAGRCGAPGHKSLSVSPSLSSKGQVQTAMNQGREGMQRQGRGSQETIVQPWGRVLALPQGIHIMLSLSSSAELKPHQMEEVSYLMKHSSFQRSQFAHHHLTPDDLWIEGMRTLQSTLILICNTPLDYKTPHRYPPHPSHTSPGWDTVLRALALCGPLSLTKQQSYSFLLHPKLRLRDLIRCRGTEARFGFILRIPHWMGFGRRKNLSPRVGSRDRVGELNI